MCVICVEIAREKISFKEGRRIMQEAIYNMKAGTPEAVHIADIIEADNSGDTNKVAKLVKAGYKKERWL